MPHSLLVRSTEVPGQYWLFLSGNIDPDQVLESDETFKKTLRDITERDDLVWGKTMHVTDYRWVRLRSAWVGVDHGADPTCAWSTNSGRVACS